MHIQKFFSTSLALLILACCTTSSDARNGVELKSAGPMTFGPKGVLFISDPIEAKIYAVETGETKKSKSANKLSIKSIDAKIAAMIGTDAKSIRINDLAVSPQTGNAFLSVSRQTSGKSEVAIFKISTGKKDPKIELFDLAKAKATSTSLSNAAESKTNRRGYNQRMSSITDLMFIDGELYIAGLSNEEFASNLRAVPYPFKSGKDKKANGSSIEIYHGAHGQFETRSPIRTFAAYGIAGETNILAAYTCTPLVRIPVSSLKPNSKVKGTTVAELGNRNRPLDMMVYKKGNKNFILMANNSRGVMKIPLKEIGKQIGLTKRVSRGKTEGIKYETIKELTGVTQLDRVNDSLAMIIVKEGNRFHLKTIDTP